LISLPKKPEFRMLVGYKGKWRHLFARRIYITRESKNQPILQNIKVIWSRDIPLKCLKKYLCNFTMTLYTLF